MNWILSPLGNADLALLLLRVGFGACVFMHGWSKLSHMERFGTFWKVPLPLCWAVAAIQLGGAVSMVLGLLTVPFAVALVVVHAAATWKLITMAQEPFVAPARHSWSIGLLYTLMPLVIAIAGPGRHSIDFMFAAGPIENPQSVISLDAHSPLLQRPT